jgi:hypothetical protein
VQAIVFCGLRLQPSFFVACVCAIVFRGLRLQAIVFGGLRLQPRKRRRHKTIACATGDNLDHAVHFRRTGS